MGIYFLENMDLTHPEDYYIRLLLNKVKIAEIMNRKVISIREDEPFSRVEQKLREFNIRHLPVVNADGRLVGIITQRDLFRIQSPRRLEDGSWYYDPKSLDAYILTNVMTPNPTVLNPRDSLAQVILLMSDTKYGCIPIVENKLCGIITQYDIIKIAARILREGTKAGEG